ncbi:MAG: 5-formyltetrahydrofolate cyclo-ligase [Rhodocyclaceae bacterium]|nr:5-formyltetrahydrofolate cyclo-ligase [Rhodocyclaceae bacterium]
MASPAADPPAGLTARQDLRRRLIAAREALAPPRHAELSAALARHLLPLLDVLAPRCVGFYWPYRAEFDARGIIGAWLAAHAGRCAALPLALAPATPLEYRAYAPGCPLAPDRHGIPYPTEGAPVQPDLLLVPCNGFDAHGYRIGYGAGYFDRTLAALSPRPVTLGIAFELARLAQLASAPHDIPLDWLVTEAGARPALR